MARTKISPFRLTKEDLALLEKLKVFLNDNSLQKKKLSSAETIRVLLRAYVNVLKL